MHDKDVIDREKVIGPNSQNSTDDFYLPTNFQGEWDKIKCVNERTIFKPEVASIILSTNSFGDFSKCTAVAEFIDHGKMNDIAKEARQLWQKFIHQPQTARCLVFFLLLGKICKALTEQYVDAIYKLSCLLPLDVGLHLTRVEALVHCHQTDQQ